MIGSMPHKDPAKACAVVARFLKEIPAWPQLSRRTFTENMYAQYSEGFPGINVTRDKIYVDTSLDYTKPLEALYTAYLANDADKYAIGAEYAAGLHEFLTKTNLNPVAVKGQVTGPLTWGLTVTDANGKAIIHDEILGDAVPKLLRLKASWQEKQLKQISKKTIIFLDEPYMAAYGSSASTGVFSSPEKIVELLNEVFEGISGVKGLHCCGNTDWALLLRTNLDILSFDAYNYAGSLGLYANDVKKFLAKGGAVAWGIVPNEEATMLKESAASLKDRLEEAMAPFTRNGISIKDLKAQSLLTPSCGLDALSEGAAEKTLELLAELSLKIRGKL
jgi:methionine synthase II (cobalamin-independent)